MRISWIVLSVVVMLALAQGAAGGTTKVNATLTGTCTYVNHNDSIGTTLYSIITCDTTGKCACKGATKLALHTEAKYFANRPTGTEKGSFAATSGTSTVSLTLTGKRQSNLQGGGTWRLGKVSGYAGTKF